MEEIDIWRSAAAYRKRYGEDAWFVVSQRADKLEEEGDHAGHRVMLRVVKAIQELERESPRPSERVN